ncbi:SDR family NAD(P)-dependent oxidoreductase [Nonomuraea bangladeshensis]|uniref:SDR family NAD(P)-dependent oxidoreductase n=1 Tax=Nonomuraea bangladeshensis TaxID=404385 RepID=A0ABV3GZ37_9ACTN
MLHPIAIVGASCRYPDADDLDRLWELVMSGRRAFRPLPPGRLNLDDYRAPSVPETDSTYARHAAVLEGWAFDRARFRVPGPVHRVTDTAHWLALEVAADALASAGFADGKGLDRDRVGVVVGNTMNGEFARAGGLRLRWPYVRRLLQQALGEEGWEAERQAAFVAAFERAFKAPFPEPNDESLAGGLSNTIAGRICNHYDFHGGGYTVDGACSSSLLAVVTAARALRAGEIDVAVAGGVDLSLDPFELVGFARTGALARDAMRVYDADPTGFWPGEGCGMVILMRADDALASGRHPLALINGWGVSSDGMGGITRPERAGQLLAIRRAYEQAGYGAETVACFEGHGTGTAVGDAVEIAALIEAQRGRRTTGPAALGSIKANIGHTKAAAGVAGLLKAVLALQRQVIPPTTGCDTPHGLLDEPGAPLRIVRTAEPWPEDQPLRAGVSAMGFGGINTHLTLESAAPRRRRSLTAVERVLAAPAPDAEVFVFASDDRDELAAELARIERLAGQISLAEHVDLAAELAERAAGPFRRFRVALVAADAGRLARRAATAGRLLAGDERVDFRIASGIALGIGTPGRVGLLFPGQGAPLPSRVPRVPGQGAPHPGQLAVLMAGLPDPAARVPDTAVAQPLIVAAALAGLRWLDALGVVAGGAAGHSLGEIAALAWAGVLGHDAAVDLASARGRIMSEYGEPGTGMLSLLASREAASALVTGTSLVVAADHGHASVVAGPLKELDRLAGRCDEAGIRHRRLDVSHAFHSPAFAAAEPVFRGHLADVPFAEPRGTVHSTITGAPLKPGDDVAAMLTAQLTAPVLYRQAVESLAGSVDLLLEVGPGHTLSGLTGEMTGKPVLSMEIGGESDVPLCGVAAALHALGAATDLRPLFEGRFHRPFDLQRERVFLESPCEQAPVLPVVPRQLTEEEPQIAVTHGDPASAVRDLVADALELPAEAIDDGDRLLSDLHLNSLRVVQLAAQAAASCGRAVPVEPLVLADVTVMDLIAYIEALPEADADADAGFPGVAPWHRLLRRRLSPAAAAGETVDLTWRVGGGGPLRAEIEPSLHLSEADADAELYFLPEDPDDDAVAGLVAAARSAVDLHRPLTVVDHGDTASGFLAGICQEHPGQAMRWIGVSGAGAAPAVRGLLRRPASGFSELVVATGEVNDVSYEPLPTPAAGSPIGPDDVVLVTGGGKGIGFQTALSLGRATGAFLVLLGRSDPATDEELAANLAALDGVRHAYARADVTDRAALRAALARATAVSGPVTVVVHSSGINEPRRFLDLGDDDYARHSAPKHEALRHLLDLLDPGRLRVLVTYGSVIGRFGLPGEAHYALANGRLRELARVLAARLPGCVVRNIDWTAWSGAGMGERLDVLDGLMRAGVVPLPVERGLDLLHEALSGPPGTWNVLATGRLPQLQSAPGPGPESGFARIPVFVPGVEAVAEVDLDPVRDGYLADHLIDGLRVLPAVVAMELMARTAELLTGERPAHLADCAFDRPVIVPEEGRTLRVCALARGEDAVEVVVRSDETGYAVDHFSARVMRTPGGPGLTVPSGPRAEQPLHGGRQLYGPTFFHGPLFQRLRHYEHLEATACVAVLDADRRWDPAERLVLGDPTVNDAAIHVLQACVPNRRLLPVACEAFALHSSAETPELVLSAAERHRRGTDHVYDVIVRDRRGWPVMSWRGLCLRDIGPLEPPAWPAVLVGPYLQRSIEALLPDSPVQVGVTPKTGGRAAGRGSETDRGVRRSHLDRWVLRVTGPAALACDWEWVEPGIEIHPQALAAARQIAELTGEPSEHTAARLWTVRECLSKHGHALSQAPLTVQGAYEQGWLLLRSGFTQLACSVLQVEGESRPIAVSVMVKGGS